MKDVSVGLCRFPHSHIIIFRKFKYEENKMEKKYDVIALGELLIDFTENGASGQGNPLFEANPGVHHVTCWPCWRNLDIRPHL